jgi:glucokinase
VSGRFVLGADVGGTKTAIALASAAETMPEIVAQAVYPSQRFGHVREIVAEFLARPEVAARRGAIGAACLSVAGPVSSNATTLTNLGWEVRGDALAVELALPQVKLVNDFAAAALGIPRLAAHELETLQEGSPVAHGTRAVVGAGTGLGVGFLVWQGESYGAHASEAGHADFAPADETQERLLAHLRRTYGHVSWERVVSGPGLMRIFSFLQETGAGIPSRGLLEASRKNPDTAEVIAEFALGRLDPLAIRALDLFAAAYGAFAGNLALALLARGGVYVAGGIAPKIIAKLRDGTFLRAFNGKGRFAALLETVPVRVVMNPQVGLYGALEEAARLCRD